jgi:hypothetical protein
MSEVKTGVVIPYRDVSKVSGPKSKVEGVMEWDVAVNTLLYVILCDCTENVKTRMVYIEKDVQGVRSNVQGRRCDGMG